MGANVCEALRQQYHRPQFVLLISLSERYGRHSTALSRGRAAGREPHLDPVPVFFSGLEASVSCGKREAVQQLLRSGKS